jgi:hypothetical protein
MAKLAAPDAGRDRGREGGPVTRRDLILGGPRLWLLAWRVGRKAALPAWGMACLARLDAWAVRLHQRGER